MQDAILEKLERLAKLKADGVLNDAQYEHAKSALLTADPMVPPTHPPEGWSAGAQPSQSLSQTWQRRFDFYDRHGMPGSRASSEAMRALPFGERARLNFSAFAFFLGPIYFLILGLWKPAITLTVSAVIASFVAGSLGVPDAGLRGLAIGECSVFATTAVPLFYEKVRSGIHSWNPFFYIGRGRA